MAGSYAKKGFVPAIDGPCLTHMMKEKERHKCETQRDTAREKDEGDNIQET